jgi:putative oxidoreductase
MQLPLSRWSGPVYALFRIVLGFLFLQHGTQKLFGWPAGGHGSPPPWSQLWIGAVIELVCGALIVVGLVAGWAAFLASGQMAVAYFQFHQPKGALPVQNGGELAVVYCFAFLLIAAKGAGIWSVDGRRRASPPG